MTADKLEPLSSRQSTAATNAMRNVRYQLFLGAGASAGAVSPYGALPVANQLVKILKNRYPRAPIDSNDSLPRAYQRAQIVSDTEHIWKTLKGIFGNADHQAWFDTLASLPWRRVWTLNVDDTFENSYRRVGGPSVRPLSTLSWDDHYTESGDLQVIHLHGHVIGSDPRRLIFSFSEYQKAAAQHPVWHQILSGVISVEPFVIIGARMLDDPDVEAILLQHPTASTAPSLVIDPYISDGNKWELEHLGYRVLRMSAADFIDWWVHELDLSELSLGGVFESEITSVPQFVRLETNRTVPPPKLHDFFGGDIPLWSDAVANRVALFNWIRDEIISIEMWQNEARYECAPRLKIIYSERLTGATSGMYLIGREAVRQNLRVYLFDRSSTWSVESLLKLLRAGGPALILIDGAADFGDELDRTMKAALKESLPIYILCSEVRRNALRLEERLRGHYEKSTVTAPSNLTRTDARSLVRKLKEFGRLGALELLPEGKRIDHFAGRDVFSAMLDVEYSMGFRRRLDGELRALSERWHLELVLLLSLAAQAARPVAIIDASVAIGVSVESILHCMEKDGHLSALVQRRDEIIAARQRDRAAEAVLEIVGVDVGLSMILMAIERLAPMASRPSLRQRNRVPLLVGHLMACRNLMSTFPGQDLDAFYERLRPVFGDWNGRYWEQRAIFAKNRRDWARAESFAARAVSLYDDAYTRTTLGTILLNKAEALAALADSTWHVFYARGHSEFRHAQELEPANRVTLFALLTATVELIETLVRTSGDVQSSSVHELSADFSEAYVRLRVGLANEENLESAKRAEKLSIRFEKSISTLT